MRRLKWNVLLGIVAGLSFLFLLLIRLEFFSPKPEPLPATIMLKSERPEESWMNIYQNNTKIGFLQRGFQKKDAQYHFNEKVFMQINLMGDLQAINVETDGRLNDDMTLASFTFNLYSGIFQFSARGQVEGDTLIMYSGYPGKMDKHEISLKDTPHISGSIYEAAFHSDMGKNMTRRFSIFDPSSMSVQSVKVTRNPDEIIRISGESILTKKLCADFMGAQHCAWIDKNGEVMKETGVLGLSMEKTTKEDALAGIDVGIDVDFTQIASVPSNVQITEAEKLREIKIHISDIDNAFFLNGGRQLYENNILTIRKETIPSSPDVGTNIPSNVALFLKPSSLIQSNDPRMLAQTNKIIKPGDRPDQKAAKIIDWVYRNIEKKPVLSVPNALEVLQNKTGDCNEHAVLTTALLRAAGIPAQTEAGLVYMRGRFYYHAWSVLYLDGWITADAVFNQFPADVTHIRLIRGEISDHINIIGILGKIKLEIMEQKK